VPTKKTAGKPAKKKVGRPTKAKPTGRPAKKSTVRKSTKKPGTRKAASPSLEDKDVRVELSLAEPGVVRVLRQGLDLSKFYQYLDALILATGSTAFTYNSIRTEEMSEQWEDNEDGTFLVWICGPVNVHPSISCSKSESGAIKRESGFPGDPKGTYSWERVWSEAERNELAEASGSQCEVRLTFRADGESPALEEGKDIQWIKPCLLTIDSAELVERY